MGNGKADRAIVLRREGDFRGGRCDGYDRRASRCKGQIVLMPGKYQRLQDYAETGGKRRDPAHSALARRKKPQAAFEFHVPASPSSDMGCASPSDIL